MNTPPISKVPALLAVGLLIGLASLGFNAESQSLAHGTRETIDVQYVRAFTDDDGIINSSSRDPDDTGIDPGYDKMVAECVAEVQSGTLVSVEIVNGYPSYSCTFWTKVRNTGDRSVKRISQVIDAPPELRVQPLYAYPCFLLKPGEARYLAYSVHVEQEASPTAAYQFTVENKMEKWWTQCW